MKIYIETDLEGISGVNSIEMINLGGTPDRLAIESLMSDINAAVDGAFAGGATHVTVQDGHAGGKNFNLALLDKRAEVDKRQSGYYWGDIDGSYSGIFFIGAHAMAGTLNGFLDHTMSSMQWFNYWINGRKSGEIAMSAMMGGHFDIPLLMVSGDEAACAEARQFLRPVECAAVKYAVGRNKAVSADPDKAYEIIKNAACRAMSLIGRAKPYKPLLPMEVRLELYRSDYCDSYAGLPGVERIDARNVRKVVNSYKDMYFI